jgi:hypothetical protein
MSEVRIEVGKTINIAIETIYEHPFRYPELAGVITAESGARTVISSFTSCAKSEGWEMAGAGLWARLPPSLDDARIVGKALQDEVDTYDNNPLVAWARETLRSPPPGPYVTLPNNAIASTKHKDKDKDYIYPLGGYEADGFQVRTLINRLKKVYTGAFDGIYGSAYRNDLGSVPPNLRPAYQEVVRLITTVRGNVLDQIQTFYSIADRLDRVSKQ